MSRFPRKFVGTVILLVIIINLWFLSQKHLTKTFDFNDAPEVAENGDSSQSEYASHQKGESWLKDPKEQSSKPGSSSQTNEGSGSGGDKSRNKDPVADNKADSAKGASKDPDSKDKSSAKGGKGSSAPLNSHKPYAGTRAPNYDAGMALVKKVLDSISEIKPGVPPLKTYNRDIKGDTSLEESGELPATSTVLGMYLQMSEDEVNTMKKTHKEMMAKLPDELPTGSVTGRGIVMTGGGIYFPMVLTAIRWVRESDKTTPIEVFMADQSEYEPHICDNLFPKLNVECRVVREIYGAQLSDKLASKYALKPLAILSSKFDDIYFMDADSYPMIDLDRVFDWDVYKETGLILNADYWPRYISPHYYSIVDINLGGRARGEDCRTILQSDREHAVPGKSTESGQVFVNKSKHIKSLLLAMYYNLYGPDHYFPLLMQGGHGEGDKDTYAAAAIICGESYYQTQRRPVTLGQHQPGGVYRGYAMSQPDPITDYERLEKGNDNVKEAFFALHANSIKSNPRYLLESHDEPMRGAPPLRQQRFFGDMGNVRRELLKDEDVEEKLFRAMRDVTCEWAVQDGYVPRDWEVVDPQHMCQILRKHVEWLGQNPDVDCPEDAPFWIDIEHAKAPKLSSKA